MLYFHAVFLYWASWGIKPNPSIYTSQRGGAGRGGGQHSCECRDLKLRHLLSLAPVPAQPGDLGEASLMLSLYESP